jgi:hypothetical protein
MRFRDPLGGVRWAGAYWHDGAVPEQASMQVEDEWFAGDYTLDRVVVFSPSETNGVEYDYYADGSIGVEGDETHTHGTHNVDFSQVRFTVDNPGLDTTAPVLDSAELLTTATLGFNDGIGIAWAAHDDTWDIGEVGFTYKDSVGKQHYFSTPDGRQGTSGAVRGRIGYNWASGPSTLVSIVVSEDWSRDREISTIYHRDGTVTSDPEGASHPATHDFDLAAMDVVVDNAEYDVSWPEISSIERVSDAVVYPGEDFVLDYEISDAHPSAVWVNYDLDGAQWPYGRFRDDSGSAAGSIRVPVKDLQSGTHEANSFGTSDLADNYQELYRGGYSDTQPWVAAAHHEVDLSQFDFEVAPWPNVFTDAQGGGRISAALAEGKARLEVGSDSVVLYDVEVTPLPVGGSLVRYRSEDVTLLGIFNPVNGSFRATGSAFGAPFFLGA